MKGTEDREVIHLWTHYLMHMLQAQYKFTFT